MDDVTQVDKILCYTYYKRYVLFFFFLGFINKLLSWEAFVPLGRLTYCTYLTHIIVLMTKGTSIRSLVYLDDVSMVK